MTVRDAVELDRERQRLRPLVLLVGITAYAVRIERADELDDLGFVRAVEVVAAEEVDETAASLNYE